jgi:hypothetical protein
MFLVAMTDIFLILYLTSITTMQSKAVLTVEDFYTLKSRHEVLQSDKQKAEEGLYEKLRIAREEQKVLAENLSQAKSRAEEIEKSLLISDTEREKIRNDLLAKEDTLKTKEQLLDDLNKQIEAKKEEWQNMEAAYKEDLQKQKEFVEANRKLAEELELKARDSQYLADQRLEEAALANKTAIAAKEIQQQAEQLKEKALKEKDDAERKAHEALAAREQAESEKEGAVKDADEAKQKREKAERDAQQLANALNEIKQNGEMAYTNNIRPRLQTLNVRYERTSGNNTTIYERELHLLPVNINGKVVVIFPSWHIGFMTGTDKAPEKLVIMYQGEEILRGWNNTEDNLVAITLPGYEGRAIAPYPVGEEITQLMPTLLALRNNGNRNLSDSIRGISDDFFIVNRDHINSVEIRGLTYGVTGFRGTGMRGERIVPGDQLVDLNGRLIGVSSDSNRIFRIDSLDGWEERSFAKSVSLQITSGGE